MEEGGLNDPESLRVGISLWPLTFSGGGMRQYVLELIPWMVRLSSHEFHVFCGPAGWPSAAPLFQRLDYGQRRRLILRPIADEDEILAQAHLFDIYFCPLNSLAPRLLDRPTVATLADVQEQRFPEYFSPEQLRLRAALYPKTARSATVLLTLSQFSKRQICQAFGTPAEKVRVVPLAPSTELLTCQPRWPTAFEPLPQRFVFYPANLYPHKNHELLLAALAELNHRRRLPCAAILTGHPTNPGVDIEALIARYHLAGLVRWYRHVPAEALRHLYEGAAALVFPSRYEGFGMPLVEAQQLGCPVIAAREPWAEEIVGDSALLVEASAPACADAIARLLTDRHWRASVGARGRTMSERYSAERTAAQTLDALRAAAAAFEAPVAARASRMTFVVQPRHGGAACERTLQSVAAARHGTDPVLVLAGPQRLSLACRTLVDNLGLGEFFEGCGRRRPGAWLEEIHTEFVTVVEEGDMVCPGAARRALVELESRPECCAAVGDVLAANANSKYRGYCFLADDDRAKLLTAPVPPAAVIWRTAALAIDREVLRRRWWANWRLLECWDNVVPLPRTMGACGPGSPNAARAWRVPLAAARESLALRRAFFPESSRGRLLRAWVTLWLWRRKAWLRGLTQALPPALQQRLRHWYDRGGRRLYQGHMP